MGFRSLGCRFDSCRSYNLINEVPVNIAFAGICHFGGTVSGTVFAFFTGFQQNNYRGFYYWVLNTLRQKYQDQPEFRFSFQFGNR